MSATNTKIFDEFTSNKDTNILKLIAIITMFIDHFAYVCFDNNIVLRSIGRLAFPLFCYCLTLGYTRTRNIKKYLLRIGLLAILIQPFYSYLFYPYLTFPRYSFKHLNILFTLFFALAALYAATNKKWLLVILFYIISYKMPFDYNTKAMLLVFTFYYCRKRKLLYIPFTFLVFAKDLLLPKANVMAVTIAGKRFGLCIFALLTLPLILIPMNTKIKINKWFFYIFYPLHLILIFILSKTIFT